MSSNLIPVLTLKLQEFDQIASERQLTDSEMNTVQIMVARLNLIRSNRKEGED